MRGRTVDDDVIVDMAAAGLGGLEVDHVDHGAAERHHLLGLAAELGLLTTGSSDFHGDGKRPPARARTRRALDGARADSGRPATGRRGGAQAVSGLFDATLFGAASSPCS